MTKNKSIIFYVSITIGLFSFFSKEKITNAKYDYIIGYNYNVEDSILPKRAYLENWDIIKNGKIEENYVQIEKRLSPEQASQFVKIVKNRGTYSNWATACLFNPRVSYIMFKKNIIVGRIDVCFECNQLESDLLIPSKDKIEEKWTSVGLSQKGIQNLKKLNDQIGLYSYSE